MAPRTVLYTGSLSTAWWSGGPGVCAERRWG